MIAVAKVSVQFTQVISLGKNGLCRGNHHVTKHFRCNLTRAVKAGLIAFCAFLNMCLLSRTAFYRFFNSVLTCANPQRGRVTGMIQPALQVFVKFY